MERNWTWAATAYQFTGLDHGEIIETLAGAGFDGLEGAPPLLGNESNSRLEAIGRMYRSANLRIETFHLPFGSQNDLASFYETVRRRAVYEARAWMEKAAFLGAEIGIQHPTTTRYCVEVEGLDTYLRALGKSLEELLPAARELDLVIALENMLPGEGSRLGSRPEHFRRLAGRFKDAYLGFCLDTGHALVSERDQAQDFFDAMGADLCAFHLQDNAGDRDSHLAPGHGRCDWESIFRHMGRLGYGGLACVEAPPFAYGPDYTPKDWRTMLSGLDTMVDEVPANARRDDVEM